MQIKNYTSDTTGVEQKLKDGEYRNIYAMLAARTTAGRAFRLARTFATAVESAGVKVAAIDNGQPTSAITVLVKAGSRYEPKPGLANVLKNFSFTVCCTCTLLENIILYPGAGNIQQIVSRNGTGDRALWGSVVYQLNARASCDNSRISEG